MSPMRIILMLFWFTVVTVPPSHAGGPPLFDSETTLDVIFEVPIAVLVRRAEDRPVVEGRLLYRDEQQREIALDITMTTRGRTRLANCAFPPMSVRLKPRQTGGTEFDGQKTLKIVNPCGGLSYYHRYLLQEFGIYKAYNALTDRSFRVRMLNARYRDPGSRRRDKAVPAFFLESVDEAAARFGMEEIEVPAIEPDQLDPVQTNIFELFQYMIGNTDWSILRGQGTDSCCHNGKVIAAPGAAAGWVVLPYDFDYAGIINARYAEPPAELGIRSVRERLYRGRCSRNHRLAQTISLFNDRRVAIEDALAPQSLAESERQSILAYVESFYAVINDPASLKREIIDRCRGTKSSAPGSAY